MSTRRLAHLVLVTVALVFGSRLARAERAVVLVGGDAKGKEMTALTETARGAAETAGWSLETQVFSAKETAAAFECVGADASSCLEGLFEAEVERSIFLRFTTEKPDGETVRVVTGSIYRRDGSLLVVGQRFCERCRSDLLTEATRELVADLVRQAKAATRPTTLLLRSKPEGAVVSVDDKRVGATDFEYRVRAGVHTVRFEKDGYHPETRDVVAGDGERLTVEVELKPTGDLPDPDPPVVVHKRSRLVAWLVVGGGGALLATAGILFALDEDKVQDGQTVPHHKETTWPAVGFGVAGVAAIGVGVYLLLRGDDEAPPRRSPVVGVDGDRAWVGVQGAF